MDDIYYTDPKDLSEDLIRENKDIVNWIFISSNKILSEDFIREMKDYVDWPAIWYSQDLSENFIREFIHKVSWHIISQFQSLSENFIRDYQGKVNWPHVSYHQVLSESFMREMKDKLEWWNISERQELSEEFIWEFKDKIHLGNIVKYQTLSEDFIRKMYNDKIFNYISDIFYYQNLSERFRQEFNFVVPDSCWLYKSKEWKLKYLKDNTNYEIVDDEYIIAYKSVRLSGRSVTAAARYKYEIGKTYESKCDYNVNNQCSFGLSAWSKEDAKHFCPKGKLLKVKINIEDIGAIVCNDLKIRCCKQTILSEEN